MNSAYGLGSFPSRRRIASLSSKPTGKPRLYVWVRIKRGKRRPREIGIKMTTDTRKIENCWRYSKAV